MARSRTLKPEFWTDEVIVELSFAARLFYQGCWNFALCDHGHIDATPKGLKLKIFPADDVDPVALLGELIAHGRLIRKSTPDGRPYMQIGTLSKHTKMDTRWNTRCPYCAVESTAKPAGPHADSDEHTETRESTDEHTETRSSKGKEGKGKEGKGDGARKRGTRIPDDFAITEQMRAWAGERVPLVDIAWHTENFVSYWRSKARENTKLDWYLTWQNWMRGEQEKAVRGARASPQQALLGPGHQLFRPEDHD